jgi:hypothetical protein
MNFEGKLTLEEIKKRVSQVTNRKEKERLVEEYFFNLIKVNRKNGSRRNSQGG